MFKRYWWMLFAMVPVGTIAGLLVAAVVTYLMPKKYESSATLEVRPPIDEDLSRPRTNPEFLPTEMEKIKSRDALVKTADALDLVNRWGMNRENVVSVLRETVQTSNIRGTDLVHIRVRHANKEDARDIVAEVARAYRDDEMELESRYMEERFDALKMELREQEDKVEERRKILSIRTGPYLLDGTDLPDSLDVAGARGDFETELALLEQLKVRLMTEAITQRESGDMVVIHDDPVIADAPVSPNVTLNLVAGSAVGLVISPLLALPLMWMMNRRNGRDGLSEPSGSV